MFDRVLGWVIGIVLAIVIGTLIYILSLLHEEGVSLGYPAIADKNKPSERRGFYDTTGLREVAMCTVRELWVGHLHRKKGNNLCFF